MEGSVEKLRVMRKVVPLGLLALVSSCAPVRETKEDGKPDTVAEVREELLKIPEVPSPVEVPLQSVRATSAEVSGITFEGVAFDSRSHRLVVVDQERGPGSKFADAGEAAASCGGLAAVNAGFFTPEGAPLGLVVAGGKVRGGWNSASSLGSGVWFEAGDGSCAIRRREVIGRGAAGGMRELLQAGPMLVESQRAVTGLEAEKTSARTVIAWDGGSRWWIGRTPPCTLADLARALASSGPAGWPVKSALNLDGGRSSELWVSGKVPGGPVSMRPMWNRPVRNFLVLVGR
jgi:uncharacterized protein YigE (DUF2233 family)